MRDPTAGRAGFLKIPLMWTPPRHDPARIMFNALRCNGISRLADVWPAYGWRTDVGFVRDVAVIDKGADLLFQVAGQEVVFKQNPVLHGLVPTLDLPLCLRVMRRATDVIHALLIGVFDRQLTRRQILVASANLTKAARMPSGIQNRRRHRGSGHPNLRNWKKDFTILPPSP